MARIERNVEIKSSPNKIYGILNDPSVETIWNITVKENTIINADKFSLKTTVGDMVATVSERVEGERITFTMEGGPFDKMGYILTPKGDGTDAKIFAEFEDEGRAKVLEIAGEMLLESLRKFAEYKDAGGDIEQFNKKKAK
ncbi:hypothetical protein LCGC14_2315040 [marine sediment metagenome]|uniref:SRPBCC family protein n=1 Tax=marine sediment metagenome TaxID=412755 RepID=A0A0F9FED1_9ZZZZ